MMTQIETPFFSASLDYKLSAQPPCPQQRCGPTPAPLRIAPALGWRPFHWPASDRCRGITCGRGARRGLSSKPLDGTDAKQKANTKTKNKSGPFDRVNCLLHSVAYREERVY